MQWGKDPGMAQDASVNFPIPFPNDCLSFTATSIVNTGYATYGSAKDRKSFNIHTKQMWYGTYLYMATASNWFAIGY